MIEYIYHGVHMWLSDGEGIVALLCRMEHVNEAGSVILYHSDGCLSKWENKGFTEESTVAP